MKRYIYVISLFIHLVFNQLILADQAKAELFFKAHNLIVEQIAVGHNDNLYFCCKDTNVYAISQKGELLWRRKVGDDRLFCSPSIGVDNTLYISSGDGSLYALSQDGEINWVWQTGYLLTSTPTIGPDGTIYLGSNDWYIYALNPDGKLKWKKELLFSISVSPVIGPDGTIYVGTRFGYLYAISPTGKIKWRYKTDGGIISTPTIGKNGVVYVKSEKGIVPALNAPFVSLLGFDEEKFWIYAIQPDGRLKWKHKIKGGGLSSPVIDEEDNVWVATDSSQFYCFNEKIENVWNYSKIQPDFQDTPIVDNVGFPIIQTRDTDLISFDNIHRYERRVANLPAQINTSVVFYKNCLYAGATDSCLYKIPYSNNYYYQDTTFCLSKLGENLQNTYNFYNISCPVANLTTDTLIIHGGDEFVVDGSNSDKRNSEKINFLWGINSIPENSSCIFKEISESKYQIATDKQYLGYYNIGLQISNENGLVSGTCMHVFSGIKWQYNLNSSIDSSPLVFQDKLFVGHGCRKIIAFDKSGEMKWEHYTDSRIEIPTAIITNDLLCFATMEGNYKINAISFEGIMKWSIVIGGPSSSYSTPYMAVGSDNILYAGFDKNLFAITSEGKEVWKYTFKESFYYINIAADHNLYIGYRERNEGINKNRFCLNVISPQGNLIRTIYLDGSDYSAPAYDYAGTMYIGSANSNSFYAISLNGEKKWIFKTNSPIITDPVISKNRLIFFGTIDNSIYAINDQGELQWVYQTENEITSSISIGNDETLYFGTEKGKLVALTENGKLKCVYSLDGEIESPPSIMDDGTLLLCTSEGILYALESDSKGLSDSSWPKDRRNNSNTGNVLSKK